VELGHDGEHAVLSCAGVPITAIGPAAAAATIVRLAQRPVAERTGVDIHLCNAYTIALADSEPDYRALLQRASMNLPDGTPVVWANRLLHQDEQVPKTRVRGPSLFHDVFELGQQQGLSHYLLGSTPRTLQRLRHNLSESYPDARIMGVESPPFRPMTQIEQADQLARIEDSGAQVVWVGLGTPKQDYESARLAAALPLVFVAVGAAFDFTAGTVKPAPEWMQDNGLEWVHRFASEPKRLWRRYVFGNARFVYAVTRNRSDR